jgi:hypothetical protein
MERSTVRQQTRQTDGMIYEQTDWHEQANRQTDKQIHDGWEIGWQNGHDIFDKDWKNLKSNLQILLACLIEKQVLDTNAGKQLS